MKNIIYPLLAILISLTFWGCSAESNLISPSTTENAIGNIDYIPVGISGRDLNGIPTEGMSPMGLFQLTLNRSQLTAELLSTRNSSLTDVLEVVDITNFLNLAPCTDCAKIKSVSLNNDGHLVVSIGIKHPFDVGDPYKPITGRNRADLHVFNVEGIIVSDMTASNFSALNQSVAGFRLLNADGYTGYLDTPLDNIYPTSATIHPYVTHFDDYSSGNFSPLNSMGFESVTNPPPSGNLVMAMGCDYDYQDYVFDLPASSNANFMFVVGCSYAVSSASKSERFSPEYRIPQHNKKAASEISVEVISNELRDGDTASTAQIEIRVVDLSHGIAVGSALNEMLANSSVDDIFINIPQVMTNLLVLDGNVPVSGTGHSPSDPLIYRGTITNTVGAIEGTYLGCVKVSDKYPPRT